MATARLREPVVLVHGLFGFDTFRLGRWAAWDYFRGVAPALEAAGNRVFTARLAPTGGVARRAGQLRAFLDRHTTGPVHLIAHSMGGLDARYLISRLGQAGRVLSLTTVGTPHRGSAFAEWSVSRFARVLRPVFRLFGIDEQGILDLMPAACSAFNDTVPDAPGVRYFSVAGDCGPGWPGPEWHLSHRVVTAAEGPNDGVVSVASAAWGESLEVWAGDHGSLVGWPSVWSRRHAVTRDRDYTRVVNRLRDEGF